MAGGRSGDLESIHSHPQERDLLERAAILTRGIHGLCLGALRETQAANPGLDEELVRRTIASAARGGIAGFTGEQPEVIEIEARANADPSPPTATEP